MSNLKYLLFLYFNEIIRYLIEDARLNLLFEPICANFVFFVPYNDDLGVCFVAEVLQRSNQICCATFYIQCNLLFLLRIRDIL